MKSMRAALVLTAVLCTAAAVQAQQPAGTKTEPIKIRAVGALLGQIEGFCDQPGGAYDWPPQTETDAPRKICDPNNGKDGSLWMGGGLGVAATIRAQNPAPTDLLVVSGNNQPASFGDSIWEHLASLHPAVIALGSVDFTRRLRGPDVSARAMRDWVASRAELPLLASNVVIKRTGKGINTVKSAGMTLDLPEDETVSWIDSVKIDGPKLSLPTAVLEELAAAAGAPSVSTIPSTYTPGENGAEDSIAFDHPLKPGRRYRLMVRDNGVSKGVFVFETDAALTSGLQPDGYPLKFDAERSLLTIAMVDPDTHGAVAVPRWKWTDGGGSHELRFLDPVKTLESLKKVVSRKGARLTVLLISDLQDPATTALLEKFPEIRFVILPPETALLGRASASGQGATRPGGVEDNTTRYSGDLAFSAIIDADESLATRVMVRPDWFGETLVTIQASLSPGIAAETAITEVTAKAANVYGAELDMTTSGGVVRYWTYADDREIDLARTASYRDCGAEATGACKDFVDMWKSPTPLAAALGDALRLRLQTDIAVVSAKAIDKDYAAYVAQRLKTHGSAWISRFILERVVWDSRRIVKAYIPGAELADKLGTILKNDDEACASGLGALCARVDADHPERLTISGRRLMPKLFYSVAVPDVLAESLGLEHSDEDGADLVATADEYFLAGKWLAESTQKGKDLGARLEAARRGLAGYFAANSLDLGLSTVSPKDPGADGAGIRQNLGLDFSGAEESRTMKISADTDWGILDAPAYAVRLPFTIDYARRRTPSKTSFDTDAFSAGLRFDAKFHSARFFGGYFEEGQLADHAVSLKASRDLAPARDGFAVKEAASFSTTYTTRRRQYHYWAGGLDVTEVKNLKLRAGLTASVRRMSGQFAVGSQTNVPTGLDIGGEAQSIDDFVSKGDAKLLDAYFAAHPDTFSSALRFKLTPTDLPMQRFQSDVDSQLAWKKDGRTYTGDLVLRYRWYRPRDLVSAFQATNDVKLDFKFGIPLWGRLKLSPEYVWERVRIKAASNNLFLYSRLDVNVSLPIVVRYGLGRLIR